MRESSAAEFDELLREHVPALFRHAFRWTGDVDEAEDLVQEALTRVYPELATLRQVERIRPWVARVMYRIFVDNLRRARRSPVSFVGRSGMTQVPGGDEDEFDHEAADDSREPSMLAEQAFEQERVAAAWSRLGRTHRVVLSLHEIESYSLEEVAAIMEIPVGTVKSRLHRARDRLRALLAEGTGPAAGTCNTPGQLAGAGSGR
jgi:RNA polymerase sigma-70 factor (ECF subfamily)